MLAYINDQTISPRVSWRSVERVDPQEVFVNQRRVVDLWRS